MKAFELDKTLICTQLSKLLYKIPNIRKGIKIKKNKKNINLNSISNNDNNDIRI